MTPGFMLDPVRPALDRILVPIAGALSRTSVTPTSLTVIGNAGVTIAALALFPFGHWLAGAVICAVFSLADLLDGTLARAQGEVSAFGAFLDPTLDRVSDAAIFIAVAAEAIRVGHQDLLALLAMFCLATSGVISFSKARAEALGLRSAAGLAARPERLIVVIGAAFLTGLGVAHALQVGLIILSSANTITLVQRMQSTYRATREVAEPSHIPERCAANSGGQIVAVDRDKSSGT